MKAARTAEKPNTQKKKAEEKRTASAQDFFPQFVFPFTCSISSFFGSLDERLFSMLVYTVQVYMFIVN